MHTTEKGFDIFYVAFCDQLRLTEVWQYEGQRKVEETLCESFHSKRISSEVLLLLQSK